MYQDTINRINTIQELRKRVRVGLDYDGVVTNSIIKDLTKNLVKDGSTDIYIITTRNSKLGLYSIINQFGIPSYNIFVVEDEVEKIRKIKQLRIEVFYDNNSEIIKQLPGVGKLI